jgi:hypothetical protein
LRPVLSCASLELAQGEQTCIRINSSSATTPTLLCFLLSCRQLYPLLTDYSSYVGVWHQSGEADSPAGALFSFRWAPNGIEVVQLQPRRQFTTDIAHQRLCMLGPGYPRFQGDLVVGGTKCVLRDYGSSREQHSNGGGSPGGRRSEQKLPQLWGVTWFMDDNRHRNAENCFIVTVIGVRLGARGSSCLTNKYGILVNMYGITSALLVPLCMHGHLLLLSALFLLANTV